MNFLLKANWGRDRRSAFLVFWSALKCKLGGKGRGGRLVCGRRSCLGPAEISSFAFLIYSRMGMQGESNIEFF